MIRLSGNNHAFRHNGLILEKDWQSFETLTDEQRACLRDYHGTHVRVHPSDYDQLSKFGLRLQTDDDANPQHGMPLVEINPKIAKSDKGDASNNKIAKSDKGDAKKEG